MRPSDVVATNYATTQAVAAKIYATGHYDGLSWWSYYEPSWTSLGIWAQGLVMSTTVVPLTIDSPLVVTASKIIHRIIKLPR